MLANHCPNLSSFVDDDYYDAADSAVDIDVDYSAVEQQPQCVGRTESEFHHRTGDKDSHNR